MEALEIKFALMKSFGTLKNAAAALSDDEYKIDRTTLSKVITGTRETHIVRARVAKHIGKPLKKVFAN